MLKQANHTLLTSIVIPNDLENQVLEIQNTSYCRLKYMRVVNFNMFNEVEQISESKQFVVLNESDDRGRITINGNHVFSRHDRISVVHDKQSNQISLVKASGSNEEIRTKRKDVLGIYSADRRGSIRFPLKLLVNAGFDITSQYLYYEKARDNGTVIVRRGVLKSIM